MQKRIKLSVSVSVLVILAGALYALLDYWNLLPRKSYMAKDFGIETIYSSMDYNQNGVDDYTDILLGAREDANNRPKYDGAYWAGGYPPENIGVCTDVVWRAFRYAGYDLKEMVDKDIAQNTQEYPYIMGNGGMPDPNIDFRRVRNLHVFFERYAVSLTTDTAKIDMWQPGDIVIFGNDKHIGIISDKRNEKGQPYIIHNSGQPRREEDYLSRTQMEITGHYRFDASLIDEDILAAWTEG